jgi:hypothetical protein
MRCPTRSTGTSVQQSGVLGANGLNLIELSDEKLLWRVSDNYFNKQQFEDCLLWANLAYHELLRQSNSNDAKIIRLDSLECAYNRRMVRCLIDLERPSDARDYLEQIQETPPHALTCVLHFQVALVSDSQEMGRYQCHLY